METFPIATSNDPNGMSRLDAMTNAKQDEGLPSLPQASRKPSLKEVATRAGVGLGSASRVLSGHASTSERMQRRVLEAAAELGYIPNVLARSLKQGTTLTVGFAASDIANPLVAEMYRGAEEILSAIGYSMVLTDAADMPAADGERLRLLRQRKVEGIIMLSVTEDHPALISEASELDEPLIVIDRELPPAAMVKGAVLTDHVTGVMEAMRHLLSLGHRRFSLITGRDVRPARERQRAMENALAELGVQSGSALTVLSGNLSEQHGAEAIRSALTQEHRPTAVILGGNQLLAGSLFELRKHGLTLGRDLSLVTCDERALGLLNDPPVAAIVRDVRQMGRLAAELFLEQRASGNNPVRCVRVPTTFIETDSCGPAQAPK